MPKAVEAIFATASHRATAELDEISAGCGIGLFALVWGGKKSLIARNLLGGTGRLPAAMGAALGRRGPDQCRGPRRSSPTTTGTSSSTWTTARRDGSGPAT